MNSQWKVGALALALILGLAALQWGREELTQVKSQKPEVDHLGLAAQGPSAPSGLSVSQPPTAESRRLQPEVAMAVRQLADLASCYDEDRCDDVPESDPRSAHFAVVGQMRDLLQRLLQAKRNQPDLDLSDQARLYLKFPDDHVKAGALTLLSEHLPDERNLEALLQGLEQSHSGPLYQQAMRELGRHVSTSSRVLVNDFLAQTLINGGLQSAQTVAENILPLINDENYSDYRRALRQLPPGSRRARDLKRALQEYARLRAGG